MLTFKGVWIFQASSFLPMRYFYQKPDKFIVEHAINHRCEHIVYSRCTLYLEGARGLAVIQQYYDPVTKHTWWGPIWPWLIEDIFSREGFSEYFSSFAAEPDNDIYPTVSVRQIMWALKMKPLKRERWETCFDHTHI